MYKIISVTDRQGNPKQEFIDDMKSKHDYLTGEFYYFDMLKSAILNGTKAVCCFIWNDNSDKMLKTSSVESISEWDDKVKIVTMNSIYVFERMEKDEDTNITRD